jgi:hypothetical protein
MLAAGSFAAVQIHAYAHAMNTTTQRLIQFTKASARAVMWPMLVVACCGTLPAVALADVTVTPAAKGYDIDITGDASSSDLIDAIVGATGVAIKGEPGDATLTANHLKNTSLERALRSLLPGTNFAVRFGDDDKPSEIIFLTSGSGDGSGNGSAEGPGPYNADTAAPGMEAPTKSGGVVYYGSGVDESSQ